VQAEPLAIDGDAEQAVGTAGGDAATDTNAVGDNAPDAAPLRWVLRSLP